MAGGLANITGIVPEGTNSHTFEPAPSDARVIAEADAIFLNGLHLEEPTMELVDANARAGIPVVSLGDRTLTPDEYIFDVSFPREAGDPNPHLWTAPLLALRYAEIVEETLASVDPANAATYAANLAWAGEQAAKAGVRLCIEPINRRDMPGFHLNTMQQAADVIASTSRIRS